VNRAILRVPSTWSEQVIAGSAARSRGLADLYSLNHLYAAPFRISIYPPGYYAALKVLGASIGVGRWISAACVFAIAVLLAAAFPAGAKRVTRLLAAAFFLSVFPALAWNHGSLVKPEFLASCFSFGGFVIYLRRGLEAGRSSWIPYAGILCGLALLTKPTAFPACAAICLHLLEQKRFRDLVCFGTITGLLLLAVDGVLFWRTSGGLWIMTVIANGARLDVRKIFSFAIQQYMTSAFVGLAAGASAILAIERSRKEYAVAAFYFLISISFFVVAAGRPGSSYSYFLDAAISGSLVIRMLIARLSQAGEELQWIPMVLVIAACLPSMFSGLPHGVAELVTLSYDDRDEHMAVMRQLSGVKTRPDEYVVSDVLRTADIIDAGLQPVVNDSFQYTLMVKNHVLSTEPLMRVLRERRAPYAILQNTLYWHRSVGDYWPGEVVDYLDKNYSCN
jgi:hypothetical protein